MEVELEMMQKYSQEWDWSTTRNETEVESGMRQVVKNETEVELETMHKYSQEWDWSTDRNETEVQSGIRQN